MMLENENPVPYTWEIIVWISSFLHLHVILKDHPARGDTNSSLLSLFCVTCKEKPRKESTDHKYQAKTRST